MDTQESAVEVPKEKRRYVKIEKGEFIRIANKHGNIKDVVEETGMSWAGVYMRLRALKAAGNHKNMKATLFQRQRPVRKAKVQEETPS